MFRPAFLLLRRFAAALVIALVADNKSAADGFATEGALKPVVVTTHTERSVTRFFVENRELSDVTVTFEMALRNLKGNTPFPCTRTVPGRSKIELFEVSPINGEDQWEYSYTNYYKFGSSDAMHDDSFVYRLPYASGKTFKVTQAYDGNFSHKGSNKYAIDWRMPLGTSVFAARGGLVVKVKDDSDKGGASVKYDKFNNYILIRHDDGTLGHYCHLQKNGAKVKPGQTVGTGELIAFSGNTGFSSGPHLHFSVFKTKDGKQRESIPVKFETPQAPSGVTLRSGRNYTAPEIRVATAPAPNNGSALGQ